MNRYQSITLRDIGTFFGGILLGVVVTILTAPYFNAQAPVIEPTATSEEIDAYFIEQMIPHHEGAVTMAEMALEKAEHEELKTFASLIIEAQTEETSNMRAWYSGWYSRELPQHADHTGMTSMVGNVELLEAAEDFDQEFLSQMIVHHEAAVVMAEMIERATARDELKNLANDIIESQTTEIEQMKEWQESWK